MQRRGNTDPGTVRTVLAKPGVECSPDLPRGLRRVSESTPISRKRAGRHRQRCSCPTRGGDSIYDKSLTGEPILPSRTANQYLATGEPNLPSRTANQYLARYWFAVRDGKIGSPVRDLSGPVREPSLSAREGFVYPKLERRVRLFIMQNTPRAPNPGQGP